MGWLEERSKNRGFRSLRDLAVKMSETSAWPKNRRVESVANRLRAADKGNDLAWWNGKGEKLVAPLAEVLDLDQSDLLELLASATPASGTRPPLWRFDVFPTLQPLDLRHEMFPGIPSQIARPGGPHARRTWWTAPPGAGKTLVGQWLETQHGWRVQSVARWQDILWPGGRASAYVELKSVENITPADIKGIPPDVKLCIASPHRPQVQLLAQPVSLDGDSTSVTMNNLDMRPGASPFAEFELVDTPPASSWTTDLIVWAAKRVRQGGGLDGPRVEHLLRQSDVSFDTPGELIGFLSMVEEVGVAQLEAKKPDPQRWIREWLKPQLDRPDLGHAANSHHLLKKSGVKMMIVMERNRLKGGLPRELLAEQWAQLLPSDAAPSIDPEHLRAIVDSGQDDALEQIRAALHADPALIIAALQSVGILAPMSASRFALRPAWVARVLEQLAFEQLVASTPDDIGALLLFEPTADHTVDSLRAEVCAKNYAAVTACVDMSAFPVAEQVAALNGAFRALGLALLDGASPPSELLRKAWTSQIRFVARRYDNLPPVPMLSIASDQRWYGMWSLCTLAISHALHQDHATPASELSPWPQLPADQDERTRCIEALERIGAEVDPLSGRPLNLSYRNAAYRLGGELLKCNGIVRRGWEALAVQLPDLLVDFALGAAPSLSDDERTSLCQLRFGVEALEAVCQRRDVPLHRVLASCWEQWAHAPDRSPPIAWLQAEREDLLPVVRELWGAAPDVLPGALYEALRRFADRPERFTPWQWLRPPQWRDWLRHRRKPDLYSYEDAWRWIPESVALETLRASDGPETSTARQVLWQRFGNALIGLVDDLATDATSNAIVYELVWSAPNQLRPALVARAHTWLSTPKQFPATHPWVSHWLIHMLEERTPGWREAYVVLQSSRREDRSPS